MTTPIVLTLRADDLDDLVLSDGNGYCYVDLDLGWPNVRVDVEERNDQDGIDDLSQFIGARAVSLQLMLTPTDDATITDLLDAVSPFLSPRRRPYLHYVLEESMPERRIRLRGDVGSAPLLAPFWQRARRVLLQWSAPDGVQELAEEQEQTIDASAESETGRSYNLVYPRVYPASSVVGAVTVTLDGNMTVPPLLRLYGPCDDPRIENQTTGQTIEFEALTLAAGEYVELNVIERTVYLNGDTTLNRYSYIDFAVSEWWELQPGDNEIRYYPESVSAGAEAVIMWRPRWL